MAQPAKDFDIPISPEFAATAGNTMPIDEATEIIFEKLKWPLLGGPSGRGWSFFSTAQRCARLFQATYDVGVNELMRQTTPKEVPLPLQIGGLFHTLQALYYAAAWRGDGGLVAPDRGGLCHPSYAGPGRRKFWRAPADAVEIFLEKLKMMTGIGDLEETLKKSIDGEEAERAPNASVVLEASRLFDAHAEYWGKQEDIEPIAIEWFARHPQLGYTCRYDMIARVGKDDPVLPPGVVIIERKTAKWIDEMFLEGWSLDGEILGQLLCWEASGCAAKFGPLTAIVVDIVSKGKIPECRRLVLPPNLPAVGQHARWVQWTNAQIHQWRAMATYPMSVANCWGRYGRCGNWHNCVLGLDPQGV